MSWDVTSPGDSDVVSQYPANERAARLHVKTAFGVDHHEAEDANIGKHDQVSFVDVASNPTFATGQIGLWNNAGVLQHRAASGTVKEVALVEDTVALDGSTVMTGTLFASGSGADLGYEAERTDGATVKVRAGATTGFIGTSTTHAFDIRSDNVQRLRVHADGGVTMPPLLASGSQGAGTFNAEELYENGVRATAFPSGTRMVFQQNAAPTGWTKDVALPVSSAFRYVHTVTGGGTGGSKAFENVFKAGYATGGTVGGTALTVFQIPSHTHDINAQAVTVNGSGSTTVLGGSGATPTGATGAGDAHTHSFTGSADLDVKYVDVIIAEKD